MSNKIIVKKPKREIEGVKPGPAQKIYEMLVSGRRYFGSSGAALTHQAFNPEWESKGINPALAKIGLEGERETTLLLKKWMSDKPNVVLVDSAHVKGYGKEEVDEETGMIECGDTDHIMLIGDEVILIDTKRWKSKKRYTVDDDGKILRTDKPFPGGNVHMRESIHLWLNYLDEDAILSGIICINTEEVSVFRNRNWFQQHYRLVEVSRMVEFLDERWENIDDDNKNFVNSTLVSQVALSAVKPFDVRDRVFSKNALSSFK